MQAAVYLFCDKNMTVFVKKDEIRYVCRGQLVFLLQNMIKLPEINRYRKNKNRHCTIIFDGNGVNIYGSKKKAPYS